LSSFRAQVRLDACRKRKLRRKAIARVSSPALTMLAQNPLLRCEQRAGWLAVVPPRRPPPPAWVPRATGDRRGHDHWSAGTLTAERSVPLAFLASTVSTSGYKTGVAIWITAGACTAYVSAQSHVRVTRRRRCRRRWFPQARADLVATCAIDDADLGTVLVLLDDPRFVYVSPLTMVASGQRPLT